LIARYPRRSLWVRLVRGVGGVCLVECDDPAGEEVERVLGWGVGFGGVGEKCQSAVGREFHGLEGQVQVADDWVVELLGPGAVEADVVVGPAGAEGLAAGGQLADEVAQIPIVGVAAGLGAQNRHDVVRRAFPVDVEVGRAGSRKTNRALFAGRAGLAIRGE
jgi:hypothetical protein